MTLQWVTLANEQYERLPGEGTSLDIYNPIILLVVIAIAIVAGMSFQERTY